MTELSLLSYAPRVESRRQGAVPPASMSQEKIGNAEL
jgi:hypothetical protein